MATGDTVIVALITELVVFVAVNDEISPLPVAANPMAVLLFVQLKLVPVTGPVSAMVLITSPLQ